MVASFTHIFFCNLVSDPTLDCIDVSLITSHLALFMDLIRLDFVLPSLNCIYIFCVITGLGYCPSSFYAYFLFNVIVVCLKRKTWVSGLLSLFLGVNVFLIINWDLDVNVEHVIVCFFSFSSYINEDNVNNKIWWWCFLKKNKIWCIHDCGVLLLVWLLCYFCVHK
jgi:hypothetical protein